MLVIDARREIDIGPDRVARARPDGVQNARHVELVGRDEAGWDRNTASNCRQAAGEIIARVGRQRINISRNRI